MNLTFLRTFVLLSLGLRPNTTRVTLNRDNLYDNIPDVMTLPPYFRRQGYTTARCGKIFHLGVPAGTENRDDPKAWDFGTPFKMSDLILRLAKVS
jgi:hypothetical protein